MKRREHAEPNWPAEFLEFDPDDGWTSRFEWEVARVKWARSQGHKQYRLLPLLQALVKTTGGDDE